MPLSKEEATARLESLHHDDWQRQINRRVKRLSPTLHQVAKELFGDLETSWLQLSDPSLSRLLRFKPRQRIKIFNAAAPGKGEALERMWQLFDRLPYQSGYTRRAFRAPGRPELHIRRQVTLVRHTVRTVAPYDRDLSWCAAWAAHLRTDIGLLLAAEIDGGPEGQQVLDTLIETVNGEHPIGMMSRSAVRALLACSRPRAWDAVESLLLAAQRQEGLRQVILETADEGHPEAFSRLIHVVAEHNLTRFAAMVRAFAVWMGLGVDVTDRKTVERSLSLVAEALESSAATRAGIGSDDPELVYASLWAWGVRDAPGAVAQAATLINDPSPQRRFVAVHLLGQTALPEAAPHLAAALEDDDARVAWAAYLGLQNGSGLKHLPDTYGTLERFVSRLGKSRTLEPLVWDWMVLEQSVDTVLYAMIGNLGKRSPAQLMVHRPAMSPRTRSRLAYMLAEHPKRNRQFLIQMVGDRSQWVTNKVFEALAKSKLAAADAPAVEALLTRKTGATRAAAITMLLTQTNANVMLSASRLLESSNKQQRIGGLEVLRQLIETDRLRKSAETLLSNYESERKLTDDEKSAVATAAAGDTVNLAAGLGLYNPADMTPPQQPQSRSVKAAEGNSVALLKSADRLVGAHRETTLAVTQWHGTEQSLYGNLRFAPPPARGQSLAEAPLGEVWADWWEQQIPDRFDLERALVNRGPDRYRAVHDRQAKRHLPPVPKLDYWPQVSQAMWWLWMEHGSVEGIGFLIDGFETALTAIPQSDLVQPMIRTSQSYGQDYDFRTASKLLSWEATLTQTADLRPELWTNSLIGRMWKLLVWLDRPTPSTSRFRASFDWLIRARNAGYATDADVLDHLVGERPNDSRAWYGRWGRGHQGLAQATRRHPTAEVAEAPGLLDLADMARNRIIDIETTRGDVATPVSDAALAIRSVPGAETLVRLIKALGRGTLVRGWSWNRDQKTGVLSHLIRVSVPTENDNPALFADVAKDIPAKRLMEIAVYAPQWARYVEHAVAMPGLEEGVHWIHAHTKDSRWSVDADIRDLWAAEVAERTPLTTADLLDGAVDVAWFIRVVDELGRDNWTALLKLAKFASGGGGHKRAELFATALGGDTTTAELAERIKTKRHQDTVRAVGLVPLPEGEAVKADEVLARYQILQEFRRGSKKFGSQRQASEGRAVEIGMQNLARTAGYADPQRLEWAMEIHEVADLAEGPVRIELDDYQIELAVNDLGEARVTTRRGDKKLKAVPAKHRKNPEVKELRDRATQLRRQVSRMRQSLEGSSIRGDMFTPEELRQLHRHPVLRPMLSNLVFTDGDQMGFPVDEGRQLATTTGETAATPDRVRVAHPADFLATGDWDSWQRHCFEEKQTQPFKQLFRELYVPTAAEAEDGVKSRRFAGHQVNPQQAMALFGSRGWVTHPEEGPVKTFHDQNLSVRVTMEGGWFTPAEVDGMTLQAVLFTERGSWQPVEIADVPPRLFSESMRDIDLVVSVAHMGGVDPEATASTVDMRRALVRETAMLMGHDNVRFENHHSIIEGTLGTYSVHLGSGVVHRQPGGAVCIIPVGSQHRGRLFLPFADDDPKTAEVVSKVVMLARDSEIKDPTILEQLV